MLFFRYGKATRSLKRESVTHRFQGEGHTTPWGPHGEALGSDRRQKDRGANVGKSLYFEGQGTGTARHTG